MGIASSVLVTYAHRQLSKMVVFSVTRVRPEDQTFVMYEHRATVWEWAILPLEVARALVFGTREPASSPPYPSRGVSQIVIGANPKYDGDDKHPYVWEGPITINQKSLYIDGVYEDYQAWRGLNLHRKRLQREHRRGQSNFEFRSGTDIVPCDGQDVGVYVPISHNPQIVPYDEGENAAGEGEPNVPIPPAYAAEE